MSKDIYDLFSGKIEDEIKNEIKKKRSRLNLKLIIISILSTLIIIIAVILALDFTSKKYIENAYTKEKQVQQLEYTIMHPNEYIGKESCRETGLFKYESTYDVAKRIGSKVIYAGSTNYLGGLSKNNMSNEGYTISNIPLNNDITKRYSSVYGLRKLHFLYPYVNYGNNIYEYEMNKNNTTEGELTVGKENIINDFHFLNEIDDNKVVEMALSFNKEYTYEQVNSILNSNLITFYWVDNNSEEEKKHIIEVNNPAFNVIGIKSTDDSGEFHNNVDDRINNFKHAIEELKNMGNTQYIKNINENNIKIIGIVVVGTSKELKQIKDNSMIKHAVLGTVTDKY